MTVVDIWSGSVVASSDAWVAGGTLALAAVTLVLACVAGWQAWLSRKALQASLRPVLVEVPIGIFVEDEKINENTRAFGDAGAVDIWPGEDGVLEIRTPFRNTGAAIALVKSLKLGWAEAQSWRATASHTAVPAGETTIVTVTVPFEAQDAAIAATADLQPDSLYIEIGYTDINAQQHARTRAWIKKHPDPESYVEYFVDRIDLFEGAADKAYASLSVRQTSTDPAA
jgi:hypothetical protein